MDDIKRKQRMVSFRISEEEYASLQLVYRAHGARSLSDFARLAMHRVAGGDDYPISDLLFRIRALDIRVTTLEAGLARVTANARLIAVSEPMESRVLEES